MSGKKIIEEAIIVPNSMSYHGWNSNSLCPFSEIADLNTQKPRARLFLGDKNVWRVIYMEDITNPKEKSLFQELNQHYSK